MNKKKKKTQFCILFLLTLLSILFFSIPTLSLHAETNLFTGVDNIEVEENSQFNLLQGVSAQTIDGTSLDVTVSNIICKTDNTYQYDGKNTINIGEAGTVYQVEYTATLPTDDSEVYTASRTIISVSKSNQTEESKDGKEIETEASTDSTEENQILKGGKTFKLENLNSTNYYVDLAADIPISNFTLECINDTEGEETCQDLVFEDNVKTIKAGELKLNVPEVVNNKSGKKHSYLYAHIGNVRVYYIGKLHIYSGESAGDYIYYTTDKQITNKTVYAVLKENDKITLSYSHNMDYEIKYQFQDKNGNVIENGPDGKTKDDIFGTDRVVSVTKNKNASISVDIPRGYKATVTAKDASGKTLHSEELGKMMAYDNSKDRNQIVLKDDSPKSMIYKEAFSIKNINEDLTITLRYEKVETLNFKAYMWTQTQYAKTRMKVHDNLEPTESNSNLTSTNHGFVWEFDGITNSEGTCELDQLEINSEIINVPMTYLANKTPITETTTLSTGTIVNLTVTSQGGTNGVNGKRHYRLEVTNCYEDLTISGGNMVGHSHKEYIIRTLEGVSDAAYYVWKEDIKAKGWISMKQDTKIGKARKENSYQDPIKLKRKIGYYSPEISFTTKEGEILQKNGDIGMQFGVADKPFVEYLIKTGDDDNNPSSFRVVTFKNWEKSEDGYYYLRGTTKLENFMKQSDAHGVTLINIKAQPIKIALNYLNGADELGISAPKAENITNLPEKQLGGENGYNVANNPTILVSNAIPTDKANEFVFDHWEIMATDQDDKNPLGYLTGEVKKDDNGNPLVTTSGSKYNVSSDLLGTIDKVFYLDGQPKEENTHAVITVRAVWKKRGNIPTIPYTVRYVIANVRDGQIDESSEKVIAERSHTVNEGAKLVSDLYQDNNKTLATSIQNVLTGDNQTGTDYTQGNSKWVIYEPKTTKQIESVSKDNNVATIYLIQGSDSINVEKIWNNENYQEKEVNVQLQRRVGDKAVWEAVEDKTITLNQDNQWKYTYSVDRYSDINNLIGYQYRVVELDNSGTVIEEGKTVELNGNIYQVGYTKDSQTNTWQITNTRLLDLTIGKVVSGELGDQSKKFTFDILLTDSKGTALNATFDYEGNIKAGYNQSITKPKDGTITFTNGKGQLTLSHGQQIIIKNLPADSKIVVSEQTEDGYSTSYLVDGEEKNVAEFQLVKDSIVEVINTKGMIPDTGLFGKTTGAIFAIVIGASGILCLGYLMMRKRKGMK